MRAVVALGSVNSWAMWSLVLTAVVVAGLGSLSSWRQASRVRRIVIAVVAASVLAIVGFDCSIFGGWVPDWFCFAV